MAYYVCYYRAADAKRATFHAVNRAAVLSWLEQVDRGQGAVHLDIYPDSGPHWLDEMPVLSIGDADKVYEYLSGGRTWRVTATPSSPVSCSSKPLLAGRYWWAWVFIKRCPAWITRWMLGGDGGATR